MEVTDVYGSVLKLLGLQGNYEEASRPGNERVGVKLGLAPGRLRSHTLFLHGFRGCLGASSWKSSPESCRVLRADWELGGTGKHAGRVWHEIVDEGLLKLSPTRQQSHSSASAAL